MRFRPSKVTWPVAGLTNCNIARERVLLSDPDFPDNCKGFTGMDVKAKARDRRGLEEADINVAHRQKWRAFGMDQIAGHQLPGVMRGLRFSFSASST